MSSINAVFQYFRFPNCDAFFNRTSNLEQHLTTCSERWENVYPMNVYQIRETLLYKPDSFGFKYTSEQKLSESRNIRLWIKLCARKDSQKHKHSNLNGKTCPGICIHFFQLFGRTTFPLQFWSSVPSCNFHWCSPKFSSPKISGSEKTCSLISRQQERLNWAVSWKNRSNVIIDGSKWEDLTRIKMIVRTIIVLPLSFYRFRRIS